MSYHQSRFKADPKRRIVWKEFVGYLEKKFSFGDHVLELGCGYGDFINLCSAKNKTAVDSSGEVAGYIEPGIKFIQARLPETLPVQEGTISAVFASNILEHLSRQEIDEQIREVRRVLKKDGIFMVFGPNYQRAYRHYFDDYTHVTAISHIGMRDWLNASGFEVTYCHPGLMPFSIKDSKLPIFGWLVKLWLILPFKFSGAQMLVVAKKV